MMFHERQATKAGMLKQGSQAARQPKVCSGRLGCWICAGLLDLQNSESNWICSLRAPSAIPATGQASSCRALQNAFSQDGELTARLGLGPAGWGRSMIKTEPSVLYIACMARAPDRPASSETCSAAACGTGACQQAATTGGHLLRTQDLQPLRDIGAGHTASSVWAQVDSPAAHREENPKEFMCPV